MEFKLDYYDLAVQPIIHYAAGTPLRGHVWNVGINIFFEP